MGWVSTQRAVDRERLRLDLRLEPLRQHRLIDIARRDVFLDRADTRLVGFARHVRSHVGRLAASGVRVRQAAFELALEELDLRAGELVQRRQILVRGHPRVGHDQNAVLDVIERQDGVEQHEAGIVLVVFRLPSLVCRPQRVPPRAGERGFELH